MKRTELKDGLYFYRFRILGLSDTAIEQKCDEILKGAFNESILYREYADQIDKLFKKTGIETADRIDLETIYVNYFALQYGMREWDELNSEVAMRMFPFRRYYNTGSNVRPGHVKLNNFIAKRNDPVWERIYPPNGSRCGCGVEGIMEDEVKNYKLTDMIEIIGPDEGWFGTPKMILEAEYGIKP